MTISTHLFFFIFNEHYLFLSTQCLYKRKPFFPGHIVFLRVNYRRWEKKEKTLSSFFLLFCVRTKCESHCVNTKPCTHRICACFPKRNEMSDLQ